MISPIERRAGFTLLEMLVVLCVLGLILAVAMPPARPSEGAAVRASAMAIADGLRHCRSRAILTHHEQALTLDLATRQFYLSDGTMHRLPAAVALTVRTISDYRDDAMIARVRFAGDGSSSGGEIHLSAGGISLAIRVDWFSGRVRLENG